MSAAPAPPPERNERDEGPKRELRIGWVPAVFGLLALVYSLGGWALAVPLMMPETRLPLLPPETLLLIRGGGAAFIAMVFGFAVATLIRARRLQPGTRGRGRLIATAVSTLVDTVAWCGMLFLLAWAAGQPLPGSILGHVTSQDILLALPGVWMIIFLVFAAVASVSLGPMRVSLLLCWFLIPLRFRFWFWVVVDSLLGVSFVVVAAFFVWTSGWFGIDNTGALALLREYFGPEGQVAWEAVGLVVTTLFSIRAAFRLLPPLLDTIETMGFRPLVAARLLRAKKSNFLATIGLLAILAVTVSSCALTTTLSVMGGFRHDLKRKILGNNAHVVIDREHATFDRWVPVLEKAREAEGVVGASPYVTGEVMVTSASNLAGGVIRGIDPETVSDVVDLRRNMVRGRLEYLSNPRRLLDLPPEETGGLIPLNIETLELSGGGDPPPAPDGESILDHLPDPDDAEAIGEFLRGPSPVIPPREVLPGVIVGQELARSLRLYVGDEVNVVSPLGDLGPAGPMPKSRPFRVAGIFYSGMYEYDMKFLYVTLPVAQRFLNVGEGISGIEIKADDVENAPAVADAVRSAIGRDDLRVQDWQERNRNLFGALELEKLAMFIALGIAILVAGFCVFGTLTLMVQEKSREVGILKAMGASRDSIVAVFMIEGLLIGLFGAGVGLGFGYVVCFAAEHFGINMNPEVYYIDKLPIHVDGIEFLLVGVASVAVCLVACVFPAVLASKTRPVDALRYE